MKCLETVFIVMNPPEHVTTLRNWLLSIQAHAPKDQIFMAMAEMVAHIFYIFNIIYLYFLEKVTVYFPFDVLTVYAK